jgi:selenocysteine-specific elongation factor
VNISGLDHSQIKRGDVLALPESLPLTRRLDARLLVLPSAPSLRHRQRLLMYHGTAEQTVELSLLERDELRAGETGLAQLFALTPMAALDGDRFILRVPSPPETVAGGVILDVSPRRHRRRDAPALAALVAREHGDPAITAPLELAKHRFGLGDRELAARLGLPIDQLAERLRPLEGDRLRHLDSTWLTEEQWHTLASRITGALEAFHRAQPLRRGISREELRSKTAIPAAVFGAAIQVLHGQGAIAELRSEVAMTSHRQGLSPDQAAAVDAFVADLELHPFSPPPLPELLQRHRLTPALLQFLVSEGRVVRLDNETALARSAYDEAVHRIRDYLSEHRTLTVAAARDLLGSSRRYVLPLLEWLDGQKITRRVGDDRILRD